MRDLYERFEEELGRRQERAKSNRPKWEPPKTKLDQDQGIVYFTISNMYSAFYNILSNLKHYEHDTTCSEVIKLYMYLISLQ